MYSPLSMASELDTLINLINEYYQLGSKFVLDTLNSLNLGDQFLVNILANMIGAIVFAIFAGAAWFVGQKVASRRSTLVAQTVTIPKVTKEPIDIESSSRGVLLVERAAIESGIKSLTEFKSTGEISDEEYTRLMGYYEDKLKKIDKRLKKIEEELELEKLKREAEEIAAPSLPGVPSKPTVPSVEPSKPTPSTAAPAFPDVIESSPLIEEMIKSIDVIVKEFKKSEK
ncbi:MAG: hypothetical protein ACP6IU_08970 [Candidatus Asgardarchaeia archaeon]